MSKNAEKKQKYNYWMAGTFTLTDEAKKRELNALVLDILYTTGIRRRTTTKINGEKMDVVDIPKPNAKGIVNFNWSIFEKEEQKGNYYDANTCELIIADCGYMQFGVAMNMILTALEAYSETPYYFMDKKRMCNSAGIYIRFIERLTGQKLGLEHRRNLLGTVAFFRKNYPELDIDVIDVDQSYYSYYGKKMDEFEWLSSLFSSLEIKKLTVEQEDRAWSWETSLEGTEIHRVRKAEYDGLQIMQKTSEKKEIYWTYICRLLGMSYEDRIEEKKKQEEEHSELAFLAELATKVPGISLLRIYAQTYKRHIFDVLAETGTCGYWDIGIVFPKMNMNAWSDRYDSKCWFYKVIGKENEDKCLAAWKNQELHLSDCMQKRIKGWVEEYQNLNDICVQEFDTEQVLYQVLEDLRTLWDRKWYVSKPLVKEILHHKDDIRYKKLVYLLVQMFEEVYARFGELPKKMVKKYLLKDLQPECYPECFFDYLDLISNRTHRKELFGF